MRPWRTFEVVTRVEVLEPRGATRVWLPAALIASTPYQRTIANTFAAPHGRVALIKHAADAMGIVSAEFLAGPLQR